MAAVLGISPGTRVIGLAVIRNGELVEWRVKSFKQKWCWDKQNAILLTIDRLCDYYKVGTISLKKVDPLRSSKELDKLISAICKRAQKNHIEIAHYSLSDLDYDVRTGKKQTKEMLTEQVANRHPELKMEYTRERNNRREYYTKMFEAVAIADCGFEKEI